MGPYEFVQQLNEDGRAWGQFHPGLVFLPSGQVFKKGRKSPVGLWYASLGDRGRGSTIVRRDKLNDVAKIEAFRWKVQLRHQARLRAYQEVFAAGKPLERIWCADIERFYVYDGDSLSEERDYEPPGGVIDRMARIPTPEQEETGRRYFAARENVDRSWDRVRLADRLLRFAFAVAAPDPNQYDYSRKFADARLAQHRVNGRVYSHYTPSGWGQETIRIWPTPRDVNEVYDYEDAFIDCEKCGGRIKETRNTKPQPSRCQACFRSRGNPVQVRTRGAGRR
jgi:hypothetical protein